MKAFSSYEAACGWWDGMSHDERRMACRAMGIGQIAAIDNWFHLSNDECSAVVKFFKEMKDGYPALQVSDDVVIMYPVN